MQNIQQKIKQNVHEKFEELKDRSVEKTRENFTRLPGYMMEQIFGLPQARDREPKDKNYTQLNDKVRETMGESFKEQDAPKLDQTRSEIEALRAQIDFVRKEEEEAKEYFRQQKEARDRTELEGEDNKHMLDIQRAQSMAGVPEPSTKAQRGSQARKKPMQTVENRVSFGKQ